MGEPQTVAGKEQKARAEARTTKAKGPRRVWCCYDKPLGEKFVLFGAELDALRYAAEHTMGCKPVAYGVPIQEQLT